MNCHGRVKPPSPGKLRSLMTPVPQVVGPRPSAPVHGAPQSGVPIGLAPRCLADVRPTMHAPGRQLTCGPARPAGYCSVGSMLQPRHCRDREGLHSPRATLTTQRTRKREFLAQMERVVLEKKEIAWGWSNATAQLSEFDRTDNSASSESIRAATCPLPAQCVQPETFPPVPKSRHS